jgi:hypothetical protein
MDTTGLSDHLGGLEEERRRDGEAQGLGGLEVDDQLELAGLLDGQVSRFGAFQDGFPVVNGKFLALRN